jgi:soluble lytic murein transglycosylase
MSTTETAARLPAPARLTLSSRLCAVALTALLTAFAAHAHAATADRAAQRKAFIAAYASASQGDSAWKQQARGLASYPLYPYLPAAALEHDIGKATLAQVQAYLARWPDLPPASDLRKAFLAELARRRDWSAFRTLYQSGLGTGLTCDKLLADINGGRKLSYRHDLAPLWQRASLPGDCNAVLDWAHAHGLLNRQRLWQRIDIAAAAGHAGVVASLAKWLHGNDARHARRVVQALRQPAQAARAALGWRDSPRSRSTASLALRGLVRQDSTQALALWPRLRHHLHFSTRQHHAIEYDLALFSAADFDPGSERRLRNLPARLQTDATRGWRIRVALARRDWQSVLDAWSAMPARQRDDPEWTYFHARALAALGQAGAARAQYASLADQATYFGFLAADRLGKPYSICPSSIADDRSREKALLGNPGLDRAFELHAVHLPALARREWALALRGSDADTRRLAALLAFHRGWYNRTIGVFSHGDTLQLYRYRFPLARQDRVREQARDAGIDPAWAYAIIRAESAWKTDAKSAAGAYGLMQVLPGTARVLAKKLGLAYRQPDDLFEPRLNIALGTHYLAQMASRYGGAPWLASTAYNAGPIAMDKWLAARGELSADLFVATMPYHETRDYVARVMAFSVIYDWRLNGRTIPLSQRMPRYRQPYAPPTAHSARQAVQCRAGNDASTDPLAP